MPKDRTSFTEVLLSDHDNVRKCDLSIALAKMEPEMADQVKTAMGSSEITAAAISRTLHRFEFPVAENAVRRCRRTCKCWRG